MFLGLSWGGGRGGEFERDGFRKRLDLGEVGIKEREKEDQEAFSTDLKPVKRGKDVSILNQTAMQKAS